MYELGLDALEIADEFLDSSIDIETAISSLRIKEDEAKTLEELTEYPRDSVISQYIFSLRYWMFTLHYKAL
jgi:hypothetical protein